MLGKNKENKMEQLIIATKIALSNTFIMYFKAQSAHWNTEGPNFSQNHEFFGDLYAELHGAVDAIAEQIRALDAYAPNTLDEIYLFKTIPTDTVIPGNSQQHFSSLLAGNAYVIESLNKLFDLATAEKNQGLADFAAGRLDIHAKHGWMIRSHTKSGE